MADFNDMQAWVPEPVFPLPPIHQPRRASVISHVGDDDSYDSLVISSMGKGPKGDKGDPTYFDDLTPEQLQEIYQAASFVGNKSYDAVVTTSGSSTSAITLPFDFSEFDMLFVDVNGLDLSEGDDYTITGNLVTLSTPLPSGQEVHFRALKYDLVDGDKNIVNTMGRKDYNTVAEMQADKELEPGDICHTLGFHTAGDGGAAWYKIKAHGAVNDMDIISLENGCVAFLQITESYVTSEMFGAWGDGEHDDINFIQRAIDYLNGGTVRFIAAKVYICSSPIILHRGICLQGSSPYDDATKGTVIKLADKSNCPLIQTPLSSSTGAATHFMMLENLTLDGNKSNQTIESNLVEFYGAYIGSIIRNVHIANFYGSGLVVREADIQLDNIWIIGGATNSNRYAMDMNPGLAEPARSCMINANNLYIEQYANKKLGDTLNNPDDRGNALRVYKCAIFNANEIHFEGCNIPITIDKTWNVILNNCSVGPSGNSSVSELGIVHVVSSTRLLSINGLILTDGHADYTHWITTDITSGNFIENVPIKPTRYSLPQYIVEDSPNSENPIITTPVFLNSAYVKKCGTSNLNGFFIKRAEDIISGMRCNGDYYTELGSQAHQDSFKPFLVIESWGTASDKVRLSEPMVLGERSSAGSVSEKSIYVFKDGNNIKRPVYQKTTGIQNDMNTIATMHPTTVPPNANASYIGEMWWDYQQKHLYIAASVGNGASDWVQVN